MASRAVPLSVHPVPQLGDGRTPYVTSGYGPRGSAQRVHHGNDILFKHRDEPAGYPWTSPSGKWAVPDASVGLTVFALAAGDAVVRKSLWISTGDMVILDHGNGWRSGYMHLRDRLVEKGQRVSAGQPVGTISFSPFVRGGPKSFPGRPAKIGLNHLHWQLYRDGSDVDPEKYLGRQLSQLALMPNPSAKDGVLLRGGSPTSFVLKLGVTGLVAWGAYKVLR